MCMNIVQKNDVMSFAETFSLSKDVYNSSFLITGATGLIGSTLVRCLLSLDRGINIVCPVRNIDKARCIYDEDFDKISFVECNLLDYLNNINDHFDYLIHCASPTDGKYMNEHPVETYELTIESTKALLNYSKGRSIKSLVYLSSLEYYGQILDDILITEDVVGYIDPTSPRSSYPLGKRAAEYLCVSYYKEYGVPVKIARLTQTFGAGVSKDDNRVFAQFARSIINGEDIVLHTTGESSKPYCYTTDCVSAILYILLKGDNGEAYNVANQDTYISIREMAEFLKDNFNPEVNVRMALQQNMGYAPITKLRLSSEKLMKLGWRSQYNLKSMFERLINSLK